MDADGYRTGRHVIYNLHTHIVLTPKYRKNVMTARVAGELRAAFEEVCGRYEATLDAFETDRDHAHLLVSYPPKVALSKLVMSLKAISSARVRAHRWPEIRQALRGEHFWSPSYCVVSCGGAPLEVVKAYVENQQAPGRHPKNLALDPSLTEGACTPAHGHNDLGALNSAARQEGPFGELHVPDHAPRRPACNGFRCVPSHQDRQQLR